MVASLTVVVACHATDEGKVLGRLLLRPMVGDD